MRNIRLVLAYDGTDFHGWQRQPNATTVQGCLEDVVERVIGERVKVYGSGRTDAGVHALSQAANFLTSCPIPCASLLKALNDALPPTVRVKEADEVPEKFHARYDVVAKTYRYRILLAPICSPFLARYVYHHPYPLDREPMGRAARFFEGDRDFTSFAGSEGRFDKGEEEGGRGEPASMVRRIFSSRLRWRPGTSILVYEIQGSGFLHHMVRNIVGTLIEVGRGKLVADDLGRILEARDRNCAGPTAPARGLCLVKVEY